jgi:cell division protein FtsB
VSKAFRRGLMVAVSVAATVLAWATWRGVVEVRTSSMELEALQARRDTLRTTNIKLKREVEALRNERETRARVAREALDVAAPGEVLVLVPAADTRQAHR